MRRLCRLATGSALLATLALGCGSSAEDSAVLRFISFDGNGIVQQDAVTGTSAVVCVSDFAGPVTPTTVNANFVNEEAADIHPGIIGDGDIDEPDRLVRTAAPGTRHAGHGRRQIAAEAPARPDGHRRRGLGAHRAMGAQGRRVDADHRLLRLVAV